MIHDTVPDRQTTITLESVIYRLRNFVAHRMHGKENAMKSGAIMNEMGFPASGTNQKLRAAAKHLLREEKIPLASCNAGFYIATTLSDWNEFMENLAKRRKGIEADENAGEQIRDAWPDRLEPRGLFG